MKIDPDLSWYSKVSEQRGLSSRCPYANVHRCPRFYQSLSLLGRIGSATEIEERKDEELQQYWENSELWPVTREQETIIYNKKSYSKFCPEVLYDRFGYFVESLVPLPEDADVDAIVKATGSQKSHWQFYWGGLKELHYSDCDLYSLLKEKSDANQNNYIKAEMVELKPSFMGISFDIKAIITNACIWWIKRFKRKNS